MKKTSIPPMSERYYAFLPAAVAKQFDERYSKRPDFYNRDKKASEEWYGDESLNKKANEYLVQQFPYHEWFNENYKFQNDREQFSYLEKWGKWIVIIIGSIYGNKWYLERVLFYDPETEEHVGYALGLFKTIYLMIPAEHKRNGTSWWTGYDTFYSQRQRLQHPDSTAILKSMDKYKYIPLEKFDKINYFHLLNATQEMVNNYEVLLKYGATKMATGLLMNRKMLQKKDFRMWKELLKKNRAYNYIDYYIQEAERTDREMKESQKRKMELKDIDKKLQSMKKLYFEYGKYILRMPESIDDMEYESKVLNHCLGKSMLKQYSNSIVNGESLIMFLREKENPERPYFTIEIKGDQLIQCRTENNMVNQDVTLMVESFIQENKNHLVNALA